MFTVTSHVFISRLLASSFKAERYVKKIFFFLIKLKKLLALSITLHAEFIKLFAFFKKRVNCGGGVGGFVYDFINNIIINKVIYVKN